MNRINELMNLVNLFEPKEISKKDGKAVIKKQNNITSLFIEKANTLFIEIKNYKNIIKNIEKIFIKQTINDNIKELLNFINIYKLLDDFKNLKEMLMNQKIISNQQKEHYNIILSFLNKNITNIQQDYQLILKKYQKYNNYKQVRISKYGGTNPILSNDNNNIFEVNILRKRNVNSYNDAIKIEKKITQYGEMYQQLSNIVMEQSEKILDIENNIDNGLNETMDAYENIKSYYNITKSNRTLIIKIFLLLIFFIILFMYLFNKK